MLPTPAHATIKMPPGHGATPLFQRFRHHAVAPDLAVKEKKKKKCLEELSSAFHEFYAGNFKHLSYSRLYSCACQVVCAGHGEELCAKIATTMAAEVDKLAASLDGYASAADAEFLRELLRRWNTHSKAVSLIDDVLLYMNRTLELNGRMAPAIEMGLTAWGNGMFRRPAGQVRSRLRAALLEMVRRERAGEAVDVALGELMAATTKMLVEAGDGLYEGVLEAPFLDETRRFYAGEFVRLLASPCRCGEYLRAVESMIDAEKPRVSRYLHVRTEDKVAAVVMEEMVEKDVARLVGMKGSGLASMLADLTRMHRLLGRVQGGVPAMRDAMEAHFRETRNTVGGDEQLLSSEKERYREMIDGVFRGEVSFHAALNSCFT